MRYAAPYLSDTAEAVIKLNTAIKAAALQFEKLPKDLSNVAVRSGHGLRLADVRVICRDSVVATMAQLTHHRSQTVRDELRAMLRDIHMQYGVCGQFMVRSASFATHTGNTWVDGSPGDGDVARRTSHAIVSVLVCTRPSAAGAVGRAEVGVPILHLQG